MLIIAITDKAIQETGAQIARVLVRFGFTIIGGQLSKMFIAGVHRDTGQHFIVRADEKLTACLELEATV